MKKITKTIPLIILILAIFSSCLTLNVKLPDDYIPNDEVVFLKQQVQFEPITYPIKKASPFTWIDKPTVDPLNLALLEIKSFSQLKEPSPARDAQIYEEIKFLLENFNDNLLFKQLLKESEIASKIRPKPLLIEYGEKLEEFSNATSYVYPLTEGAIIYKYNSGNIQILFPDGSNYNKKKDEYFLSDSDDNIKFYVKNDGEFTLNNEKQEYSKLLNGDFHYQNKEGELSYLSSPYPQYSFTMDGVPGKRVMFINDSKEMVSIALFLNKNFRIDFFASNKSVLASNGTQAINIRSDYTKTHSQLNSKTNEAEHVMSIYLPEGIRLRGLRKPISYSEINPRWPANYLKEQIGGFSILYTKKDKNLLNKLDKKKLIEIPITVYNSIGFKAATNRVIILPPDLNSYRKHFVSKKDQILNWYPSGFQTTDYIVMWPPSVPRYKNSNGQKYFWNQELYEILIHEYTHLAIGEISGLINPIPVWLNEGLAVYVESSINSEVKKYWETTFHASKLLNSLLNWEDVTLKTTSEFPVSNARTHYAQSYAMVKFLIENRGKSKVISYLKGFRQPLGGKKVPLATLWKSQFHKVFGISWEENLINFETGKSTSN